MTVLVAGIGNIFLGDDGFGCEVARELLRRGLPDDVRVVDYGTGGLHLAYDLADGVDRLVLVDALPAEGAPHGEVVVLEASLEDLPSTTIDGHGMDPAAVLRSLQTLGADPPPTVVVGCRVSSVEEGIGLTAPVASAVAPAADAVEALIERGRVRDESEV